MNALNNIESGADNAVIYCRVSSAAQIAKGHGIQSQATRCREFARMKGYDVKAEFRDEAVSGGIIDRPGMQELLAFVAKHKSVGGCVVLIDDISRLARDIKAHLDLRGAISEAGGRLESPSIEFGEDSDSILVENLLASVSQHQRQKNTEQVKNRQRARLLGGYWTFRESPGYRYEAKAGEGKVLIRDEPLASIIEEGLVGFATGRFQTQAEVKRFFESFPDFPKTRHGHVTNEAVNRILTRVLYAGYLERPEWNVSLRPARHEALICLEVFDRIQARLNEGVKLPARADINADFPLRGFVLCACGSPLTACWSTSKTGKKHPYYMCFKKGCDEFRKSIPRAQLEGEFEALLSSVAPSKTMFDLIKTMFADAWSLQKAQAVDKVRTATSKIATLEKQIAGLLDRIVDATNPTVFAAIEGRIATLEREKLVMREKLDPARQQHRPFDEMFELALRFLSNPQKLWESSQLEHKRTVLKLTFEERLLYSRNKGFRTPKTSIVFNTLEGLCTGNTKLAEGRSAYRHCFYYIISHTSKITHTLTHTQNGA